MRYLWKYEDAPAASEVRAFAQAIRAPEVVAKILMQRGVHNADDARAFLKPKLENLHDPFKMLGMDRAVERILRAIERGEAVMVFGDYDADGTTSVALMTHYLKRHLAEVIPYIPDRHEEGYGLSITGMERAAEAGCGLVIALDCGIKGHREIEWANDHGLDVIVCDHHLPGSSLPEAWAILNPKQDGCSYPYKELCGCGVGFKLMQGVQQALEAPFEELVEYLDLVAVAISADLVPITGENRILAFHGLQQLQESPRPGLKACLPNSAQSLSMGDVAFQVAPRINAAGRLQHGIFAVEMLMSETEDAGNDWGERITRNNEDRKEVERTIAREALEMLRADNSTKIRKTTVVYHEGWHKGVVGIVASRLQSHYYRPTVVLTESNGFITGSVRSVKGFDVHAAIESCADLLEQFGGHASAAGLSMHPDKLNAFAERFEEVVASTLDPSLEVPVIRVDAPLEFQEITWDLKRWLNWMEPYGMGNPQPVFAFQGVWDSGRARIVGSDASHLKLQITDGQFEIDGIGFGLANKLDLVRNGRPFNICFRIVENNFRGKRKLEIQAVDIEPS